MKEALDLKVKRRHHRAKSLKKGERRIMHCQASTLSNSILVCFFVFLTSGCTLKASTESLTDATTNFSSSTTPGAWFTVDGLLKPHERVNAFLAMNNDNLQQNMAQGNGEYLIALGTLLDIPDEQMTAFILQAQERFHLIYGSNSGTPHTFAHFVSEIK